MTTILVVDDSAMDRRLAGGLIERESGFDVVYANDGNEALAQLELHVPDLVVTDMQMPNLNGFELVKAVRAEYPLIPVILMTARGSEEIAVQALQYGAASYVSKRQLALDLTETVQRVLSASGEERGFARLMNRMTRNEFSFVIENDASLLSSVVSYLQQAMTAMRLCNDSERLRAGIALEEALLNAYYHGNLEVSSDLREADHTAYYELARNRCRQEPYCNRQIHIEARLSAETAVFRIRDEGAGFDPSALPDPTDPANIECPSGRGLLLIQTFMDEIRFNERGNEITLIKHRESPAVEQSQPETSQ